jgi:hypothetical protein
MKKLLTFLFALMLISNFSFGTGNRFYWAGPNNGSWTNPVNWAISPLNPSDYTSPVPGPGAATWPGQIPGEIDDYVIFNFGATRTIIDVPTCELGRLEILPSGANATTVRLKAAVDGNTITFNGGIIFSNLWTVKIDDDCNLYCNLTGGQVKIVCQPGVNFWQKNNAQFFPAEYTVCPVDKGFLLQANANTHAEYIQQELTTQSVKGWQEIYLSLGTGNYHYVSPPISSDWPVHDEYVNRPCRVPNCLCVFEYDYVRKYVNNSQSWDNWLGAELCFGTTVNIEQGRGYEVYLAPNTTPLHTLYGTFNSGQINISPNPSGIKLPVNASGWNFIGNPYASAITFAESGGSPTAGEGWTWERLATAPVAYWWDNCLGFYRSYNWYTGLPQTNTPPVCPGNTDPKILGRGQGFFVYVIGSYTPTSDIWVSNLARRFRDTYEIGKSQAVNNMNLSLNDSSGNALDNVFIGFRDDVTTTDFDYQLDAFKIFNEIANPSQLYCKTTNNIDASVKCLKLATGKIMIPIYMKVTNTGTYSIDANTISTFSQNTGILLKDNKTNTTVDLKVNPVYTFTATTGDDDARFNLYFSDVLYGINNLSNNTFKVYSYDNSIYIQNNDPKSTTGIVLVYDMIGKQMMQENLNSDAITRINTNLNKGFYIVSIKTDNGVYNQKVYIN